MQERVSENTRFYGWVALSAAALVYFLINGAIAMSAGAFLPFIITEFSWSRGALSGAFGLGMTASLIAGPAAGWFIAKYGARKAIMLGNMVCALGFLMVSRSDQLWHFYVAYGLLIGFGSGIGGILAGSTVASNWFVRKIVLAMALLMTAGGIGGMVMMPLIGLFIKNLGWRSTYQILAGIIFVVGVVIAGVLVRNRPEDIGQKPDGIPDETDTTPSPDAMQLNLSQSRTNLTLKDAIRTKTLWLLIVMANVIFFLMGMILTHQIAFLMDIGVDASKAAATIGIFSAASTLAMLMTGGLSMKVHVRTLTLIGTIFLVVSMGIAMITQSLSMAVGYTVLFGLGAGVLTVGIQSLFPIYFGRNHYAEIAGFAMPFGCIGGGLGPVSAGILYDVSQSYFLPFTVCAVVAGVGCLSVILLKPPVHAAKHFNKKPLKTQSR